jgi:hypothetical protein
MPYGASRAPTAPKDEARRIAVSFEKLSDLLAALPRLIVNNMARGVYLIGSKLAQRVRAVQIVDCAGNSTTLRLKDYISQKIEPEYKTLPWQQDVAVLLSTNEKAEVTRDEARRQAAGPAANAKARLARVVHSK